MPGAARTYQNLPGTAKNCQEMPEAAGSCDKLPRAARIARSCLELPALPAIARSYLELPKAAQEIGKHVLRTRTQKGQFKTGCAPHSADNPGAPLGPLGGLSVGQVREPGPWWLLRARPALLSAPAIT